MSEPNHFGYERSPSVNAAVDMFEANSRSTSSSSLNESRPVHVSKIPRSVTNPRLPSSSSSRRPSVRSSPAGSPRPSISSIDGPSSRSSSPRNTPRAARRPSGQASGIPRPKNAGSPRLGGVDGRMSIDQAGTGLGLGIGETPSTISRSTSDTFARPPVRRIPRPSLPTSELVRPPRRESLQVRVRPKVSTRIPPTSPRTPTSPRLRAVSVPTSNPVLSVSQPTPERRPPRDQDESHASSSSTQTGLGSRRTSYRLSKSMDVSHSGSRSGSAPEDGSALDLSDGPSRARPPIPRRTSSTPHSQPTSPTQKYPPISPRNSSRQAFPDLPEERPLGQPEPSRRSPGLRIDPMPPFSQPFIVRPSPPIPAKSPLRTLSRHSSISSRISTRVVSGESTVDTADSTTAVVGDGDQFDLTPQNRFIERLENRMTYASAYSQESASPDVIWEGDPADKRVRRRSRMDDLWGRSRETDSPEMASPQISSPQPSLPESPKPVRSPSAPMLNGLGTPSKAAQLLGIGEKPPALLPSAMTRSPTAPTLSPVPGSATSKRTHLIREIATTERAYARDLALIRDAYLSRYRDSRRGSIDKRASTDWSTISRSPSGEISSLSASVTSFKQPSPAASSRNSMGPPVGKPLSPSDVRAVFLNIDQLVIGAEDLATAFENATGEEESGPGSVSREGEGGTDRLGEVFTSLIPQLRPMYLYYCSRQQFASVRLVELLSDTPTAAHLNDCWRQIKSQTHAWNLDSMLIKPVQRITKYPLLFEDLLACTTPVHPDYFNIRAAAELARTIAVEIDEAKRRKDVVASALGTRKPKPPRSSLPSPAKEKKGLSLFRKDKPPTATIPSDAPPPEITRTSIAILKDLVNRVDEADQVVRRVGKEVILWTASAKEIMIAEDQLLSTWSRFVQLDADPAERIVEMRRVLNGVINDSWALLNDEVRERVMPIFSKLLDSTINPRKVIVKRESKSQDYLRYFTLVKARKAADRSLLLSARDFYALHCQLVDELPIFLDGYTRILDLALVAFADAQARYFEGVKVRLDEYTKRWIARPRKEPEADLSTGKGIVQAWHGAWQPYATAMEKFECTKPARAMATRLASFNARPGSRPSSRPSSRVGSPRPTLQHSSSFTRGSSDSINHAHPTSTSTTRARSTSLLGPAPPPLPSPSKESRFNLLRVGSRAPKSTQNSPRTSRPSSLHIPGTGPDRYSFGLPKIPDNLDGHGKLGISPASSLHRVSPTPSGLFRRESSKSVKSVISDRDDTVKVERRKGVPPVMERRPSEFGVSSRPSSRAGIESDKSRRPSQASSEKRETRHLQEPIPEPKRPSVPFPQSRASSGYEIDAAEGWRGEPVLYQCACVADFDPFAIGNKRYRGLRFLSMQPGDLFEVYHEVGRIDELPKFPYPEVGVDNDGVLVGKGENGAIGLLICSFLEPLRE